MPQSSCGPRARRRGARRRRRRCRRRRGRDRCGPRPRLRRDGSLGVAVVVILGLVLALALDLGARPSTLPVRIRHPRGRSPALFRRRTRTTPACSSPSLTPSSSLSLSIGSLPVRSSTVLFRPSRSRSSRPSRDPVVVGCRGAAGWCRSRASLPLSTRSRSRSSSSSSLPSLSLSSSRGFVFERYSREVRERVVVGSPRALFLWVERWCRFSHLSGRRSWSRSRDFAAPRPAVPAGRPRRPPAART